MLIFVRIEIDVEYAVFAFGWVVVAEQDCSDLKGTAVAFCNCLMLGATCSGGTLPIVAITMMAADNDISCSRGSLEQSTKQNNDSSCRHNSLEQ